MKLNRRELFVYGAGAVALVSVGGAVTPSLASMDETMAAIKTFTGGAEAKMGLVELTTPEIAENGNTVPIKVSVESPMTADNYVQEVIILAAGNPNPGVATFKFSVMSGEASASTRIRLAKTQDIIAVAKMSDGTFAMDKKQIKVTIGGCGG